MPRSNISIQNITENIKGISFELMGGIDGFLSATSNGAGGSTKPQQLRRVVPWLAKATDMTAAAVSNLPFYILRENGDVYDYSGNYENKLGGLPNPESLFYLLAASLCVGRAYLIPTTTSSMLAKWQYCAPQSITAEIDADGVKWFDRQTDKGKRERLYPYSEKKKPQLLYFWLPDPDVEIGEPLAFPAGDALMAANLLYSMDSTISVYSERGFVPATLLAVKGMPAANERERAETWWNRFLRGWTKEAAKILNAETMDVKQVGAGMTELKGSYTELTKQAIENIGTAFGIPSGLFMSDMSYATEVKHLIKLWYSTSAFIKIYKTIESTFNEQLLAQWGLKLKFAPDELEAFQEEEAERAAAFKVYVDAGFKRSWAAQMVGLDLPEGVEADMLDQYAEEQDQLKAEREKEQFTARWGNKYGAEIQKPDDMEKKPPEEKKPEEKKAVEVEPVTLTAPQIKELNLWRQIAERNVKKGKGACADFEVKSLDESVAGTIRAKLMLARNVEDVTAAFEVGNEKGYMKELDIQRMIDALEANLTMIESDVEPEAKTFFKRGAEVKVDIPTINIQVPEQPAPIVNVPAPIINITVPEQPAPVIQVNVPEQPAPVVNLPAPVVNIPAQSPPVVNIEQESARKLVINRDTRGNITSVEKK